jgi:hypothetical protein
VQSIQVKLGILPRLLESSLPPSFFDFFLRFLITTPSTLKKKPKEMFIFTYLRQSSAAPSLAIFAHSFSISQTSWNSGQGAGFQAAFCGVEANIDSPIIYLIKPRTSRLRQRVRRQLLLTLKSIMPVPLNVDLCVHEHVQLAQHILAEIHGHCLDRFALIQACAQERHQAGDYRGDVEGGIDEPKRV